MYFFLKDNLLYSYTGNESYPSYMIFMLGSFVKNVKCGTYRSFEICHEHRPTIRLQAPHTEDRNQWVKVLTEASNTSSLEDDYKIQKICGRGKFSVVYRGVTKDTYDEVAIKVITKSELDEYERSFLGTELAIVKVIKHPNIVELVDVYEDMDKLFIVSELIEGGELFDYISKKGLLSESEAALISYQILDTLEYLHECSIVHRDLKPENILVELDASETKCKRIKVTDFGLSKMMNPNEKITEMCGTLAYVAPEVLMREGYNKKVDTWSAGIIAYLLLCGSLPFDSESKTEIFKQTCRAKLDFDDEIWELISPEAKDVVTLLLKRDPDDRPSIHKILKHDWFKKYVYFDTEKEEAVPVEFEIETSEIHRRKKKDLLDRKIALEEGSMISEKFNSFSKNISKGVSKKHHAYGEELVVPK